MQCTRHEFRSLFSELLGFPAPVFIALSTWQGLSWNAELCAELLILSSDVLDLVMSCGPLRKGCRTTMLRLNC